MQRGGKRDKYYNNKDKKRQNQPKPFYKHEVVQVAKENVTENKNQVQLDKNTSKDIVYDSNLNVLKEEDNVKLTTVSLNNTNNNSSNNNGNKVTIIPVTKPTTPVSSWSQLFANNNINNGKPTISANNSTVVNNTEQLTNNEINMSDNVDMEIVRNIHSAINDYLQKINSKVINNKELTIKPNSSSLLIRGLTNPKNKCFLNVILQILISTKLFYLLFNYLSTVNIPIKYEVISLFSKFYVEMTEQNDIIGSNTNYSNSNYSRTYSSITPSYFYKILDKFNPQYNTLHIYQEDAHEFLYFLLDKMHEEFLSINNLFKQNITGNSNTVAVNNDDEWEEVGKGNKSSIIVTKSEDFSETPITNIFGGKIRSSIHKHQIKASVTYQPFYTIALDIKPPSVFTIDDALELFLTPESLEEYTDFKTKKQVEASKHTSIEQLPKVLIFHLKRFAFAEGTHKIDKKIHYPALLTLPANVIAKSTTINERKYNLYCVLSHLGTHATNGHYTCDIKQKGHWYHYDDSNVYKTSIESVLDQEAYLLFYEQA